MPDHGTRRSYQLGCKCLLCRAANASYQTQRKRKPKIDINQIVEHLKMLSSKGLGHRRIAALTGVHWDTIRRFMNGKRVRATHVVANKILAVRGGAPALNQYIASGPTWKKIRWLLTEGFTLESLSERIGRSRLTKRKKITVRTAARIDALYHRLRE